MKRAICAVGAGAFAGVLGCISINVPGFGDDGGRRLYEKTIYSDTAASFFGPRPGKVLMIPIDGVIVRGAGRSQTSPARIQRYLQAASYDPSISGLLLKVNSPGGTVVDSDLIFHLIQEYAKKKKVPVYAHIDGMGASGGYYAAMAAGRVNASPTSMVGSIGVIMRGFAMQGLLEKLGVQYRTVQSGDHKDMGSPFRELKPDEEAFLKKQITYAYEQFLGVVQQSRGEKIAAAKLKEIADGSVYNAKQAVDLRLIDSMQHLDAFLDSIKKERDWPGLHVVTYVADPSRDYSLYDSLDEPAEPTLSGAIVSLAQPDAALFYYLWEPPLR